MARLEAVVLNRSDSTEHVRDASSVPTQPKEGRGFFGEPDVRELETGGGAGRPVCSDEKGSNRPVRAHGGTFRCDNLE